MLMRSIPGASRLVLISFYLTTRGERQTLSTATFRNTCPVYVYDHMIHIVSILLLVLVWTGNVTELKPLDPNDLCPEIILVFKQKWYGCSLSFSERTHLQSCPGNRPISSAWRPGDRPPARSPASPAPWWPAPAAAPGPHRTERVKTSEKGNQTYGKKLRIEIHRKPKACFTHRLPVRTWLWRSNTHLKKCHKKAVDL